MHRQVTSRSPKDTAKLGEAVGRAATGRLVIALTGNLGSGKTVFVQGLAKGLSVPKGFMITSPSYTLINEYPGRLPLFHADLYRLSSAVDIESTGLLDTMDAHGVIAIEWAERICEEDLTKDVTVRFDIKENDIRVITITGCGQRGVDLIRDLEIEEPRSKLRGMRSLFRFKMSSCFYPPKSGNVALCKIVTRSY